MIYIKTVFLQRIKKKTFFLKTKKIESNNKTI